MFGGSAVLIFSTSDTWLQSTQCIEPVDDSSCNPSFYCIDPLLIQDENNRWKWLGDSISQEKYKEV
jgi:hypothetical protein